MGVDVAEREPAPPRQVIWAANSRRRSSASMRPAAMRGTNWRHDVARRPCLVDEGRHLAGAEQRRVLADRGEVGADADAGRVPQPGAEGPNPGAMASTDVLVTMPSRWARRMPRDTAGVSP